MSELLPVRIPKEDLEYLEERARLEQIPKSTLARKLLHEKIIEERIREAINMYLNGTVSLGKAAEHAGLSLREFIAKLVDLGVTLRYTIESLREDLKAAREWSEKLERK